ncbi:nucleotidyltransferase family protein [Sunxiuqinia sp. sy24]|uniref:nucleotidyltransferase family protein n=1 Tax=Sunxiuqinia sp. sy24 TaxID=3461495 RepID=UPI004045F156
MQAMIFAAGLGTRLQPLTNSRPKALVEIHGKNLLERCLLNLKKQGINDVVINVHHFATQIKSFLQSNNNFGMRIQISDETDELLDTGGGILKAKPLFKPNEPILILNVDVLTNLSFGALLDFHQQEKALASLVVRQRDTSRYLLFNKDQQLTGWKNMKTGASKIARPEQFEQSAPYAFSGIQLIQPELLNRIEEHGKFSSIDLYLRLAKSETIKAFIDDQSIWMDLGKIEQMQEAASLIEKMEQRSK